MSEASRCGSVLHVDKSGAGQTNDGKWIYPNDRFCVRQLWSPWIMVTSSFEARGRVDGGCWLMIGRQRHRTASRTVQAQRSHFCIATFRVRRVAPPLESWLSRPGARCLCCYRSVSPGRSPNPPCVFPCDSETHRWETATPGSMPEPGGAIPPCHPTRDLTEETSGSSGSAEAGTGRRALVLHGAVRVVDYLRTSACRAEDLSTTPALRTADRGR